jgi:DNA recombination protein RmuC
VRTTNDATGQLRTALQNPRLAGSWGEISLDRIVELAGMSDHVDFDRQTGMRSSEGTSERPDLTIHLTGGLNIPVDAKALTANYIKAVGEANEAERARLLKQSAADLRSRVVELRNRAYDKIPGYAGMTMLYVPNEAMLSSALAQEPEIVEDALRHHIVICSPLLFLSYLRAFAHGWRLQKQAENAEEVARRGRMLYERLQSFFAALGKVGHCLNQTVEKFNVAVGKMDNLLVPGRELSRLLGISGDLDPIDPAASIAREVRYKDGNGAAVF